MRKIFTIFVALLITVQVYAQPVRIAVAANARFVVKSLQADFKKKTGIETEAIIGSSGKLTAQIKNGAPYDLFLSADMDFPENLFKTGFGISPPKEYASGCLILCSASAIALKDWQKLITGNNISKVAIANPELAPYGKAAEQVLHYYGLADKIRSKLVFGESISQVNTYITTGSVSVGFTTQSLIYESPDRNKLKWIKIDPKVYGRIRQGMVILNHSRKGNYEQTMKFYNYLSSPAAKQLLKENGYQLP